MTSRPARSEHDVHASDSAFTQRLSPVRNVVSNADDVDPVEDWLAAKLADAPTASASTVALIRAVFRPSSDFEPLTRKGPELKR